MAQEDTGLAALFDETDPRKKRLLGEGEEMHDLFGSSYVPDRESEALMYNFLRLGGLTDPFVTEEHKEHLRLLEEKHPTLSKVGGVAGFAASLVPFVRGAGILSKIPVAGQALFGAGKAGRTIAGAGGFGAAEAGARYLGREIEAEQLPSEMLTGAAREAGTMAAFLGGHRLLGAGARRAVGRLPATAERLAYKAVPGPAREAALGGTLFGTAEAVMGGDIESGMAAGAIFGAVTRGARFTRGNARQGQVKAAVNEAVAEGLTPESPGWMKFLKGRMTVGPRKSFSPQEMKDIAGHYDAANRMMSQAKVADLSIRMKDEEGLWQERDNELKAARVAISKHGQTDQGKRGSKDRKNWETKRDELDAERVRLTSEVEALAKRAGEVNTELNAARAILGRDPIPGPEAVRTPSEVTEDEWVSAVMAREDLPPGEMKPSIREFDLRKEHAKEIYEALRRGEEVPEAVIRSSTDPRVRGYVEELDRLGRPERAPEERKEPLGVEEEYRQWLLSQREGRATEALAVEQAERTRRFQEEWLEAETRRGQEVRQEAKRAKEREVFERVAGRERQEQVREELRRAGAEKKPLEVVTELEPPGKLPVPLQALTDNLIRDASGAKRFGLEWLAPEPPPVGAEVQYKRTRLKGVEYEILQSRMPGGEWQDFAVFNPRAPEYRPHGTTMEDWRRHLPPERLWDNLSQYRYAQIAGGFPVEERFAMDHFKDMAKRRRSQGVGAEDLLHGPVADYIEVASGSRFEMLGAGGGGITRAMRDFIRRMRSLRRWDLDLGKGLVTAEEIKAARTARHEALEASLGKNSEIPPARDLPPPKASFLDQLKQIHEVAYRQENRGQPDPGYYHIFTRVYNPVRTALDLSVPYFKKTMKGITNRLHAVGAVRKNSIFGVFERGVGMTRQESTWVYDVLDGVPVSSVPSEIRPKVERISKVFREIFDELFTEFGVKRYRKNYISHLNETLNRMAADVGERLEDIDVWYEKPRKGKPDAKQQLIKDPLILLEKYVSAGTKKKFLKGPVEQAKEQLLFIRNNYGESSQGVLDMWTTFIQRALGRPTKKERFIKDSANNFARMMHQMTGSEYFQRAMGDPFFGDKISGVLTSGAYMHYVGLKPMNMLRDMFQTNIALSELGMYHGVKAAQKLFSRGHQSFIDEVKRLQDKGLIDQFEPALTSEPSMLRSRVGDVYQKATDTSMVMIRISDMFNRAMTNAAAESRFDTTLERHAEGVMRGDKGAIQKFRNGILAAQQAPAIGNTVLGLVKSGAIDEARFMYARHFVDKWQFKYGKMGTPMAIQGGPLSRMVGMLATWPLNITHSMVGTVGNAFRYGGVGAGVKSLSVPLRLTIQANLAVFTMGQLLGIDIMNWFAGPEMSEEVEIAGRRMIWTPYPSAMHAFGPGPFAQQAMDVFELGQSTLEGNEYARDKALADVKRNFKGPLYEKLAPIGLLNFVNSTVSLMSGGVFRDRDTGELIDDGDITLHLKKAVGAKDLNTQLYRRETARLRDVGGEESSRRQQITNDAQKALAEEKWVMSSNPGTIVLWLMKNYPTETWLWGRAKAIHGRLTKTRWERRRGSARRGLESQGLFAAGAYDDAFPSR
ncbi:MAG: hypothetical protein GY937_20140 [bacterium]|nr:hypothetical protein [bacterium]